MFLSFSTFAQQDSLISDSVKVNKAVFDSAAGQEILIGKCTTEGLKTFKGYSDSWDKEYNDYKPYTDFLSGIKDSLDKIKIVIVMATWCGDSKREVPRFYKIMNTIGISDDDIDLICVDRNKKAGNLDIEDYYVELVPTFIFYKGKKELGRIIEMPSESLENDIAQIITSE
jgi:thiol-disulfide isomerase/thioredoxin